MRLVECSVQLGVGAGRRHVLRTISLNLHQGELVTIRGVSGSGKTTLAMVIAGLLLPSSGRVENYLPSRGRQSPIQMVFQDPYVALNPVRSVAYWLSLGVARGAVFGGQTAFERSEAIAARGFQLMERMKLSRELLPRRAGELSGGEQQRFALVTALLASPACLVLDEPTSMLDLDSRSIVESVLNDLLQEGKVSIVLLTHDKLNITSKAQRYFIIENGRVN